MCLAMEALRQAPREAWALREVTTVIADFVDCARHYAELIAREIGATPARSCGRPRDGAGCSLSPPRRPA